MATRGRCRDRGHEHGRAITAMVLRELAAGRHDRNISGQAVANALGCSASQYSRIERGRTQGLTFDQAAVALEAVGLRLWVRVEPGGAPVRDAAHAALIDRLRGRCHPSIHVLTEVPLPDPGDRRAWDVVLAGRSWRHAVEVETRPRDRQALERRLALKARDSGLSGVSLLLLDSRHNREFVRLHGAAMAERFPVSARDALAALRAGDDPGAGAIILL